MARNRSRTCPPASRMSPLFTGFRSIRSGKCGGRGILHNSHKLGEVKRLCDPATILRGGRKISTCNPQLETAASLARMMVGADIKQVKAAAGRQTTVPRLVVNDLSLEPDDPHGVRLKHISLEVKGGEILGIAAAAGDGHDELFAALLCEPLAQDAVAQLLHT